MQKEFLEKYFPIGRTNQMSRVITVFHKILVNYFMRPEKDLRTSWESAPHAVLKWQLVQYFYDSLSELHRQMVGALCGDTFMTKNEDEEWELFNTLSDNFMHHAWVSRSDRVIPTIIHKKSGIYE